MTEREKELEEYCPTKEETELTEFLVPILRNDDDEIMNKRVRKIKDKIEEIKAGYTKKHFSVEKCLEDWKEEIVNKAISSPFGSHDTIKFVDVTKKIDEILDKIKELEDGT